MKKDTYYFSHDYGARNDPKLMKLQMVLGHEGKGVYWDLVEMLYEQSGYLLTSELQTYAFELRTTYERITQIVGEFDLFESDGERFWSNTIIERLKQREEKSNKARESIEKRWNNTNVLRSNNKGNTIKERKGKENKEEIVLPNSKRSVKNIPASTYFYKTGEAQSQSGEYKILCRFICGENKTGKPLKKILSLPEQLTEDQFNILKDKAHQKDKKVIQMILDCEGKDSYTKGRENLYLILNSWLNHTK